MQEIKDCSLVLEGGTFRTVYTAGVLDAFMENQIVMPYIAAISAGQSMRFPICPISPNEHFVF